MTEALRQPRKQPGCLHHAPAFHGLLELDTIQEQLYGCTKVLDATKCWLRLTYSFQSDLSFIRTNHIGLSIRKQRTEIRKKNTTTFDDGFAHSLTGTITQWKQLDQTYTHIKCSLKTEGKGGKRSNTDRLLYLAFVILQIEFVLKMIMFYHGSQLCVSLPQTSLQNTWCQNMQAKLAESNQPTLASSGTSFASVHARNPNTC